LNDRYRTFLTSQDHPQYTVNLRWMKYSQPMTETPELIFDPGEIWKMYQKGSTYYASFDYKGANLPFQESNILITNPEWNQMTLIERITGPDWISLLNTGVGELILRTAILFVRGLVFHASGLDDNGSGIVFIGHSGAGKSTQVAMWQKESGVIALNDDRIAIVPSKSGLRCYGTPWGGSLNIAKNHSAPLKAIIILEQASTNQITRFPLAPLPSWMMARTFLPYWDKNLMVVAMKNLELILSKVPVYLLRCRPEKAVIPLVRSIL